jgi:UDP-GlcNAc3NAcA epimerase
VKVLTVIGARPQFIKAGPVSRTLEEAGIEEVVVHTGQHYDDLMSRIFFDELKLRPPNINLEVGSGSHGCQTGAMLSALDGVLQSQKPDYVLVYGDTNSTLAGALAATKLHFPVAHVEAGLRSFNRRMPEEINRIVVDSISDLLFAPTRTAVQNLRAEGVQESRIVETGDVMYDATLIYGEVAARSGILDRLKLSTGNYVLVTIHRAENTDDCERMRSIVTGLAEVARTCQVIWPVHPRTRKALRAIEPLTRIFADAFHMIEPVGYLDMLQLEKNAAVIATDSGGIQKEAFFCKVPCVTLRGETEWTELVDTGWNVLCPPISVVDIAKAVLLSRMRRGLAVVPYGDGRAASRIVRALIPSWAGAPAGTHYQEVV